MKMAPVTVPKSMDLSGRTPIYRLTKTNVPPPPRPAPPPPPPPVHHQAQPSPFDSPYHSPYPSSQSAPEDGAQSTPVQPVQQNKETDTRSLSTGKRRGRKLQENEILILVNCCIEFQSVYADNRMRFWYCVATSLKRQIKRNFSCQSCQQIVDELVAERRERRREIAAGKSTEQPLTELRLATDKWIAISDQLGVAPENSARTQLFKRQVPPQSDNALNLNAAKRSKIQEQPTVSIPMPNSTPSMAPPTIAMTDMQNLRLDVQRMRQEMHEMKQEFNDKLGLVLQTLQKLGELHGDKEA